MTRQSEPGPKDGTYVIQIEIPEIDPFDAKEMERFEMLHAAIRRLSTTMFPETWITFHRQMPEKGRHSGPINPNT